MDPALALLIGGILLWISILMFMVVYSDGCVDKQLDEKIKKELDKENK